MRPSIVTFRPRAGCDKIASPEGGLAMANTSVEDAARAVEQKIDATREGAGRVRERVSEAAENVKARAAALRDKFAETEWEDVKANVAAYVRDNPGKSLGIALGIGFAIGLLMRRRDD
jgi:ElaB/YqjD/DUF883 family membrane-anchored ribosome-binding protein